MVVVVVVVVLDGAVAVPVRVPGRAAPPSAALASFVAMTGAALGSAVMGGDAGKIVVTMADVDVAGIGRALMGGDAGGATSPPCAVVFCAGSRVTRATIAMAAIVTAAPTVSAIVRPRLLEDAPSSGVRAPTTTPVPVGGDATLREGEAPSSRSLEGGPAASVAWAVAPASRAAAERLLANIAASDVRAATS